MRDRFGVPDRTEFSGGKCKGHRRFDPSVPLATAIPLVAWTVHRTPCSLAMGAWVSPPSAPLRLCRRWSFVAFAPGGSHPFSVPASKTLGCPALSAPCAPADEATGFPAPCIFRRCRGMKLRGAPKLIPTGGTGWRGFEFPRSPCLPAAPLLRLRVSPSPATAAGPMTTSYAYPNFASSHLASAADESSRATSLAPSGLTLDALSFSFFAPLPASRL